MFSSEYSYSGLVILDYRESKIQCYRHIDCFCISETRIISDLQTDGHTDRRWENNSSPLTCGGVWILHIRDAYSSGVTTTYAFSPNCPLLTK